MFIYLVLFGRENVASKMIGKHDLHSFRMMQRGLLGMAGSSEIFTRSLMMALMTNMTRVA